MKKSSFFLKDYVVLFFYDFQSFDNFVNMTESERIAYVHSGADFAYFFCQTYSVGTVERVCFFDFDFNYSFIFCLGESKF